MKKVKDIMSKKFSYCTPLDNVYEAAVKMKKFNVDVIPIIENEQLIGMVTNRDIVIKGVAEKHPGSTKITDIMTREVVEIAPEATVEEAAQLFAVHPIQQLPVVENGQMIGMVNRTDVKQQA